VLRKIIEDKFPQLAVLSYQELSDLKTESSARISWN
jgi:type III secretory pathway component EscV